MLNMKLLFVIFTILATVFGMFFLLLGASFAQEKPKMYQAKTKPSRCVGPHMNMNPYEQKYKTMQKKVWLGGCGWRSTPGYGDESLCDCQSK